MSNNSNIKRVTARAKAHVIIEFDVESRWGDDCTVGQVFRQAAESAENRIRNACAKSQFPISVVDVKVTGVMTGEER